ncbi:glutamate ABC transporter substrate-binding protein [Streptomyces sp. RFCAC02]|uniref:glutamate ABC transporter substrate-binding protein n=1 Tax=Streptomyces sp. RFCAC02 TaxID=2499143 RepID=UPI00101FB6AC|nr:glutamate ABC transporter substrate-binding protein [Streptomyces sp. RFCAC02]
MRSPRRIAALAAVLLLAGAAGCSAGDPSGEGARPDHLFPEGTSLREIQDRGTLVVGVKFDQPAFGLLNPLTGEPEGFDIEIARLVAEDLTGSRDNISFVETVTANREAFIQQGKVDMVVASYVVTDARLRQVSFAGPYYDTGISILARKDDRTIRGADDLNDRPVCVAQGSQSAHVVPEVAPRARLTEFSAYSYCAQALKDGRVDAVVTSESILIGLAQQNPDELAVVPGHLEPEEAAIGFTKDDAAMHDYLDGLLTEIARNGAWEQAYADTVGRVTHDSPTPPEPVL